MPSPTIEQVNYCALPNWYATFRDVTIPSKYLRLDASFVNYLKQDDFFIPNPVNNQGQFFEEDDDGLDVDDFNMLNVSETTDDEDLVPKFDFIEAWITDFVKEYGPAFCKLNWSSPRDAAWIACNQSLKCYTPADVFLLLKTSDFTSHDLENCYDDCVDVFLQKHPDHYYLVLRKFKELNPALEFRVFVHEKRLIAISSRDHLTFHAFLNDPSTKDTIQDQIQTFFQSCILPKIEISHFVIDIHLESNLQKVTLVDINPFADSCDPLLFTWTEIESLCHSKTLEPLPIFRHLQDPNLVSNPIHLYRLPADIVDMTLNPDASKLAAMIEQQRRCQNNNNSSSDDSDSDFL